VKDERWAVVMVDDSVALSELYLVGSLVVVSVGDLAVVLVVQSVSALALVLVLKPFEVTPWL